MAMARADEIMRPAERSDIYHNVKVKHFPDGSKTVLAASAPVFRESGWEERAPRQKAARGAGTGAGDTTERARRRARAAVRDLARCNPMTHFITLTFDPHKVASRYDPAEVVRKTCQWADNQAKRRGVKYILIPEHHKDGAIHFHGFCSAGLPMVDSGHKDTAGHKVWNVSGWSYGFSTAIELYGDYAAAVSYVCKYIGKQADKIGGRWYYSGGGLQRPEVTLHNMDWNDAEGYEFAVPAAGARFRMAEIGCEIPPAISPEKSDFTVSESKTRHW